MHSFQCAAGIVRLQKDVTNSSERPGGVCLHVGFRVFLCSYSLEGLSGIQEELRGSTIQEPRDLERSRMPRHNSDDRGSLVSLTEEQEEWDEDSRLQEQVSPETHTHDLHNGVQIRSLYLDQLKTTLDWVLMTHVPIRGDLFILILCFVLLVTFL